MRITAFIIICIIYGGANFYAGSRMLRLLKLLGLNVSVPAFVITFAVFASTALLSFIGRRNGFQRAVYAAGSVWMGILMYLLLFTAAADIILLAIRIAGKSSGAIKIAAEIAVIVLTVITVACGAIHAADIKTARYFVPSDKNVSPLKIVMISDIHIGALGIEHRLQKIADTISAEEPDVVCIAGDIFNNDYSAIENPSAVADTFRSIKAKYGVFACLGNHDGGTGLDDMLKLISDAGITLLREEYAVIPEQCVIFGRADGSPIGGAGKVTRGSFDISGIAELDSLPLIVIDHNPAYYGEYGGEVTLLLCGHTHGGQLFPGSLITESMYDVSYGQYKASENSPTAVVSSGIGYWGPPLRVGTDAEITVIELV